MAKLIYWMNISIDGFVEDVDGNFEWGIPDEEEFRFINDLARPIGTYLYGRRLYETMVYWETAHTLPDQTPFEQDFAEIWQAADKVVYSKTVRTVSLWVDRGASICPSRRTAASWSFGLALPLARARQIAGTARGSLTVDASRSHSSRSDSGPK